MLLIPLRASACWHMTRSAVGHANLPTATRTTLQKPTFVSRAKPTATVKLKYHLKPGLVTYYKLLHIQ